MLATSFGKLSNIFYIIFTILVNQLHTKFTYVSLLIDNSVHMEIMKLFLILILDKLPNAEQVFGPGIVLDIECPGKIPEPRLAALVLLLVLPKQKYLHM